MINKIGNYFEKIIIFIGIIFLSIILYGSFFVKSLPNFGTMIARQEILFVLSFFIMILIFLFINHKIDNINEKYIKIIKYVSFIFLFVIQIILISNIKIKQTTDPYIILDQAKAIAMGIDNQVDYNLTNYFLMYSNNNLFLIIEIIFSKLFIFFNVLSEEAFIFLNTILINISILFSYLLAKELSGYRFGVKVLLISVLNPINYLFIFWVYTATFSIAFVTIILYLITKIINEKGINKKNFIRIILISVLSVFGYYLRPVIIIPTIAGVIILFFSTLSNYNSVKKHIINNKKKLIVYCLSTIAVILLTNLVLSYQTTKVSPNKKENLPLLHWVMMGLHGEGRIDNNDNAKINAIESKKEKKKVIINEIIKTLKEKKVGGLLQHISNKMIINFSDGYSFAHYRMINIYKNSKIYNYIGGNKRDFTIVYSQGYRIVILFLTTLFLLWFYKKKNLNKKFFLLVLSLIGFIIFYTIWEVKESYSIPIIPVIIILSVLYIDRNKKIYNIVGKLNINVAIFITMLLLFIIGYHLANNKILFNNYIIRHELSFNESIDNIASKNKKIIQTLYTDSIFNNIDIYAKKIGDGDTSYLFELYCDGKIVDKVNFNSNMIMDNKINIKIESKRKGYHKYILIIYKDTGNTDTIGFYNNISKTTSMYKGSLKVNNKRYVSDLSINVYDLREETYLNKKTVISFIIILIILEIYLLQYIKKTLN